MVKFLFCLRTILIIAIMSLYGCYSTKNRKPEIKDHAILKEMIVKDQEMRSNDTLDMEPIDKTHRQRVMDLLANSKIITTQDKFNAALILQHTALIFCNEKLISVSPEIII